jgi:hypothetical protein
VDIMKLHVPRLRRTPTEGVDPTARRHTRRLEARVAALEEAVEESRRLNQRLADVIDVVTEVLVPAADRDDERLAEALANLNTTLDDA